VVRGGKLICMYKRPGHRVIINTDGDLIVRPMFIEASIQRVPGGSAVSHHVLAAYQRSYVAIMKSQFCAKKGVQGGREVRSVQGVRVFRSLPCGCGAPAVAAWLAGDSALLVLLYCADLLSCGEGLILYEYGMSPV
jgi:hypothetical protein